MSTELCTIKNTGPRFEDLSLTRFWGGSKAGVCVQLTGKQEDGKTGYIQLSIPDLVVIWKILNQYIIEFAQNDFGKDRIKNPEIILSDEVEYES